VIDEAMGDDIRVTVIATGFDHGGVRAAREERARPPRDRGPRIDDRQRDSLVIRDDDLDIPPFLR
jgi:cell division protein FtsZ